MIIEPLIELCQQIGKRVPAWTQGPGGNVSQKVEIEGQSTLLIKASGFRLDDVNNEKGLAQVNFRPLLADLSQLVAACQSVGDENSEVRYAELLQKHAVSGAQWGRPSMETGFHALLPSPWVIHFHALSGLLMAHEYRMYPDKISAFLDESFPSSWRLIEPCRPGLLLSKTVAQTPNITLFLLERHGVILQGDNTSLLEAWQLFEKSFCKRWSYDEILTNNGLNRPTPMRIFFPDTAVFLERLHDALRTSGWVDGEMTYLLRDDAENDLAEIWQATELLFNVCPKLSELPEEISSVVADLPTEQFRALTAGRYYG